MSHEELDNSTELDVLGMGAVDQEVRRPAGGVHGADRLGQGGATGQPAVGLDCERDRHGEGGAAGGPAYFLVNCAHPEHVERGLGEDGPWRERIHGLRVNASTMSHEELDNSTELDAGDPVALDAAHRRLERSLPAVGIIGGCCGTDSRHVAALWRDREVAAPARP